MGTSAIALYGSYQNLKDLPIDAYPLDSPTTNMREIRRAVLDYSTPLHPVIDTIDAYIERGYTGGLKCSDLSRMEPRKAEGALDREMQATTEICSAGAYILSRAMYGKYCYKELEFEEVWKKYQNVTKLKFHNGDYIAVKEKNVVSLAKRMLPFFPNLVEVELAVNTSALPEMILALGKLNKLRALVLDRSSDEDASECSCNWRCCLSSSRITPVSQPSIGQMPLYLTVLKKIKYLTLDNWQTLPPCFDHLDPTVLTLERCTFSDTEVLALREKTELILIDHTRSSMSRDIKKKLTSICRGNQKRHTPRQYTKTDRNVLGIPTPDDDE